MPDQPELTIQGWGPAGPDAERADSDLAERCPRPPAATSSRELGWTPAADPAGRRRRDHAGALAADRRGAHRGWSTCSARRTSAPTGSRGCGGPAARATWTCCAAARATPPTPRTPSCCPAPPRRPRRCSPRAASSASSSSRSAGARASSAGWPAVDPDDRPCDRRRPVPDGVGAVARRAVVPGHRRPGHARPGAGGGARPRGADLRATCRRAGSSRPLGGYAATRSAGQASTGVGRFDELVAGADPGDAVRGAGAGPSAGAARPAPTCSAWRSAPRAPSASSPS